MKIELSADAANAGQLIPGAFERNTPLYRQSGSMGADISLAVPIGSSSMDGATIAEREREGGGAPSQRHRRLQVQARTGPALKGSEPTGSRLTGGFPWFQILRPARR